MCTVTKNLFRARVGPPKLAVKMCLTLAKNRRGGDNYLFPHKFLVGSAKLDIIYTIIVFAEPFQTTTPETGDVVTAGASAETHSQNEQQDGTGEVR